MLKRDASKRLVAQYKSFERRNYKRNIRVSHKFETIEEVEYCFIKYLDEKYPGDIVKDMYIGRNFIFGEAPNHQANIIAFYRHPSRKYKDVFLMSMKYKINSANSTRAFVGGQVEFFIQDNELRRRGMPND